MEHTAVAGDFGDRPESVCWCCGDRTASNLLRLHNHGEVGVCFRCVDWLAKRKKHVERMSRQPPPGPWWRRLLFRAGVNRC